MDAYQSATPFGRRPMTLGQISNQMAAKALKPEAVAHKWQAFQDIREAREQLGATDRSLAILNALLTFHPEVALTGDSELVVWPSNEQLSARSNGMPATTLRRHIAVLVNCGLVIRRDSPNGKRFARKGRGGEIEQAYGFDLSPIVARVREFRDLADAVRVEKKAYRLAKERITLLRRDIVKLIGTGRDEGVPGDWEKMQLSYQTIIARLPRSAPLTLVEAISKELAVLQADLWEVLESFAKSLNLDANESQNGCHLQNSNPENISENKEGLTKDIEGDGVAARADNVRALPNRELPLGIVLDACPSIRDLVQGGEIRHWRDFLAGAELARPMLGISLSAWREAKQVLGEHHAAITLAAIYQRADQITSPGGYLRSLADRAKEGRFSTWPMVMALLRAKLNMQAALNDADAIAARLDEKRPTSRRSAATSDVQSSARLLASLSRTKR